MQALNFVLALEHMGNAFYNQSLARYLQDDFVQNGLPTWARGRWVEVAEHQATYVSFLENVLGDEAVQPCTYSFPHDDPWSFAELSYMLETISTSAYSGAARYLDDKDLVSTFGSILAVKARHSAWVNSAIEDANPWSTAFDTPLNLNQILTLTSPFVVSCPATQQPLVGPFKTFPQLSFPPNSQPGQIVRPSFEFPQSTDPLYVWFTGGFQSVVVPINEDRTVSMPPQIKGSLYAMVLSSKSTMSDDHTVAGPAFLNFNFDANDQRIPLDS
ncbi:hypothetical protein PAXINDRAFT_85011 [Paxillus involutus ATCC 200175]|uniref:Uncharacterized protein n=1 Tax=Paxillus involutus ATCC 200175 TaxID=664439 RepID=A0A0C9SSB9_PAXIN|nr:hypothetical protein PAXINDRAFT_85011 [Paxillus involutus ATCC 200175]